MTAGLWAAVLDLVVPQGCAGCASPGTAWCETCADGCDGGPVAVPMPVPARAAAAHRSPAGRAVVAYKDAHVRRLARPLGTLLARAVGASLAAAGACGEPVWLVPIPSRRAAVQLRGVDHMAVLAARAAGDLRHWGVPAHRCRALRHHGQGRDQVGLTRHQRQRNVAHTLRAQRLPPGTIVLVDDVTTTGATLREALRAFAACGRQVACAASVTSAARSR